MTVLQCKAQLQYFWLSKLP